MAKTKRNGRTRLGPPKAALAPSPLQRTRKGEGTALMLMVPVETLKTLRTKAAEKSTTVRALVLEALRTAGYAVPVDQVTDRRRRV
jgi:hypothetical protein